MITITESSIYWISKLDTFLNLVSGIMFAATLFLIMAALFWFIFMFMNYDGLYFKEDDEKFNNLKRKFKKLVVLGGTIILILLPIKLFLPTTKQYCAMKVIPAIVNNVDAKKISQYLNANAGKWLEDNIEKVDKK